MSFTARDLAAAAVAVASVEPFDPDLILRDLIADSIGQVAVNAFYAAYKQQVGTRRAVAALRMAIATGLVWHAAA